MNNKRVLSKIKMGNSVKPNPYNKDIIVDPMGQWNHPGKNTRIPSDRITMKGVNYPVLGVSNTGQKQMMQPGREYNFPGANYVDEYPQMANGGAPCPSGQKVYPDFKDFGCLTQSQYNSLKQQKTTYINKRNAASKNILDLKNAGKFNEYLQKVKNYQTQYPNQSFVCPGPNCPNEVLKVPKNIIIEPPKPKDTPPPPINPVIKEPIELPIIDPPLLENKDLGELRTSNFTVSDPIEAPQYTLEPYTANRMRLDVKLPQNKLKSWFDKGVIDTKGHIELGKRNETRLIPRIVQKVTGYDPAYFEGYEDEEGNFVHGELDYGNETGSEIEFKGAASLRDFMNQKKYKKEYEEYDKKLNDWNEKYEQSKKKQEEGQAFKKGGAKKKYTSDIINSTNYLFAEHPLFKKKKQSKKRIYDPKAKYYADGGGLNKFVGGGPTDCDPGYIKDKNGNCIKIQSIKEVVVKPKKVDPVIKKLNSLKKKLEYFDSQNGGLGPTGIFDMTKRADLFEDIAELEAKHKKKLNNTPRLDQAKAVGNIMLTVGKYFMPNNAVKTSINYLLNGIDAYEYSQDPNDKNNQSGVASDLLSPIKSKRKKGLAPFSFASDIINLKQQCDNFEKAKKQRYDEGGEYFELELTPEEIEEYRRGGYIVEELDDYAEGGEPCPQGFQKDPVTGECVQIVSIMQKPPWYPEEIVNPAAYVSGYRGGDPRMYKYGFLDSKEGQIIGGGGFGFPKPGVHLSALGVVPISSNDRQYFKGAYEAGISKDFKNLNLGLGVNTAITGYPGDNGFVRDPIKLQPKLNLKYNFAEGGALLTKKVTCKKCGWTWDAADGGNDLTTCHKCGGQGLIHAQKGGYINNISVPSLTKASYGYSVGNLIRKQDGGEKEKKKKLKRIQNLKTTTTDIDPDYLAANPDFYPKIVNEPEVTVLPNVEWLQDRANIQPNNIQWYESRNRRKWGLNDYSDYGSFNSAFRNARASKQDEFIYKDKRYNTDLIPKEESDLYWESKNFLKDYYQNEPYRYEDEYGSGVPSEYNTQEWYIKNKYGTTWEDLYDKIEATDPNDPKYVEMNQLIDKIMKDESSIFDKTNKDYNNYRDSIVKSAKQNVINTRLSSLNKPSYFSITNQKPKSMSADGYWNEKDNKTFMYTESMPGKLNTTYVHELSHKGDDILDVLFTVPDIDIKKINDSPYVGSWGQEDFSYVAKPSEIEARKLSTLFYLYKNKKPYKSGKITQKMLDDLYANSENLPYDIKQLLDLYGMQQDDLLKYLNGDYSYKQQKKQYGGEHELGDEVDEATMKKLKKLGYTFEKI